MIPSIFVRQSPLYSYSKIREEKIQDFQFIFKNFTRPHMKLGYVLKWALDAQIQQRYFMLLRPLTGCFFAFGRFNRFKFKESAFCLAMALIAIKGKLYLSTSPINVFI